MNWPADRVERRSIATLIPNARNARTHTPEQVQQIANSMREWGWTNPVLVDECGGIIAGHGRVLAAGQLGFSDVPVMVAEGWSDAQKRAYALADNQLALNAGWDMDVLADELRGLADWGFDLSLTGFDNLDALLARGAGQTDPDAAPPLPETPISRLGDVWLLGRHRLVCGDCGDAAVLQKAICCAAADLVVTSPPYNQRLDQFKPSGMQKETGWVNRVASAYFDSMPEREYQEWQRKLLTLWYGSMRDGASLFYNHKHRYRDKRVVSPFEWLPDPFVFRQEIVWSRPGSITQNARMFLPSDERIYWLYKGADFTFHDSTEIKSWSTVWEIKPGNDHHAVGFPVELPLRCIRAATMPDDVVLEPFSGSGTTIIAAEMTGRACRAIELSPAYVDVAVLRWQAFVGNVARLDGDGRSFDDVAAERLPVAA